MIEYAIGASPQVLQLSDHVLRHFAHHRQIRFWHREAGGQLFAGFSSNLIAVEEATGPRPSDRRTRLSYEPNTAAEQAEIAARHPQGLHFIGDWHTHPERVPMPSPRDLASMADCFRRSRHGLRAFVLVIVGQLDPPIGLHVSLHDGQSSYKLQPRSDLLPLSITVRPPLR